MTKPSQYSVRWISLWSVCLLSFVVLLSGCPKRSTVQKTTRAKQAAGQKENTAAKPARTSKPTSAARENEAAIDTQQTKRYDQPREAAEYYLQKRLPAGVKELPVERYLEAQEHMNRMPQYASAEARFLPSREQMRTQATTEAVFPAWTALGPNNVGGRTRALLLHPTNPSVMYAAGAAGGVWKTTNGGQSWTPIADLLASIAVNTMLMDAKNPDTIYAGTGEGYFNYDSIRGAGIFKTTDGGATWTQLASTKDKEDF